MMLAAVSATASFAQNPNIGKEIKATKDYKAVWSYIVNEILSDPGR